MHEYDVFKILKGMRGAGCDVIKVTPTFDEESWAALQCRGHETCLCTPSPDRVVSNITTLEPNAGDTRATPKRGSTAADFAKHEIDGLLHSKTTLRSLHKAVADDGISPSADTPASQSTPL